MQVVGLNPYEKMCFLDTTALCRQLISTMQPPEDVTEIYSRHLAILVWLICTLLDDDQAHSIHRENLSGTA